MAKCLGQCTPVRHTPAQWREVELIPLVNSSEASVAKRRGGRLARYSKATEQNSARRSRTSYGRRRGRSVGGWMGGARGPRWPLPPAVRCESRACIYSTACGIAVASERQSAAKHVLVGAVPHRVDGRPHMRVPVNARVQCARSVTPVYAEKSGARGYNSGECAGVAAKRLTVLRESMVQHTRPLPASSSG